MKYKTLVVNEDEWRISTKSFWGCSNWNHWDYDEFEALSVARKEEEKYLSELLNNVAKQGYKLLDERIRNHACFVANKFDGVSHHGIYRFVENTQELEEYYVYFGPLINMDFNLGWKNIGCLGCSGAVGCKGSNGSTGSNESTGCGCKNFGNGFNSNLGCKGQDNSDEQFINFNEDQKNEPTVQQLNKYFGLRQENYSFEDGYIYDTAKIKVEFDCSDYIKSNQEYIMQVFNNDIKEIEEKGFHFERIIEFPSEEKFEVMLFSKTSKLSITEPLDEESTVHLSDFDLWYFPAAKGLLEKLFKRKSKTIYSPDIIDDANKLLLETQYNEDFNKQIEDQEKIEKIKALIQSDYKPKLAEISINAYRRKKYRSLKRVWKRLLNGLEYYLESDATITFEVRDDKTNINFNN